MTATFAGSKGVAATVFTVACLAVAPPALGQSDPRVEISVNGGYTFSEGIPVNSDTVAGTLIDEVNPKSGGSYGINGSVFLTEQTQVGFQFAQQFSTLELKGAGQLPTIDATDMTVNNYHGVFTYNWGFSDSMIRPFAFGGLGATHYAPDDIMGRSVDSATRFSTTWGGGVKVYANDRIGFNFTGRWVPTYINSDPAGIWCSPYWPFGCWVASSANFSNQFELGGGVNIRF